MWQMTKAEVERRWRVDAWSPAWRLRFDARCEAVRQYPCFGNRWNLLAEHCAQDQVGEVLEGILDELGLGLWPVR